MQDAKCRKRSPSEHHRTTLSSYVFATKVRIDNRKKTCWIAICPHMSLQCSELWPTSVWDRFGRLGHPSKFQRVSHLGSVTARHSGSGRQPNFAAFNRGCQLYSEGRPSRWALAHILHCVSRNVQPLTCYIIIPITIIFGRSVTKKVTNQKMPCFPTSPI